MPYGCQKCWRIFKFWVSLSIKTRADNFNLVDFSMTNSDQHYLTEKDWTCFTAQPVYNTIHFPDSFSYLVWKLDIVKRKACSRRLTNPTRGLKTKILYSLCFAPSLHIYMLPFPVRCDFENSGRWTNVMAYGQKMIRLAFLSLIKL